MGRFVQLLLLIVLAYIAWRLLRRALAPPQKSGEPQQRFEPTVRCTRCGMHVPAAEIDAGVCARCRTAPE